MKHLKTALALLLPLLLISLTLPVSADGTENALPAKGDVVTEYYSEDLLEPLAPVSAPVAGTPPEIKTKSAVLMEASTGKILFAKNENEAMPPASITKIMSILLFMEALDGGRIAKEDVVTCSEHAAGMGGSQIWLEPGETMTVHELLKAVVIGSANDATTALAEHIAGSEEGFVGMMNQRAKELGMKNTNFTNCSGLDHENLYTSALDVAIMSRELTKHEGFTAYSTVWMDSLRGGSTQLVNTNKLVRFYDGCTGIKTGTTSKAGHCLSASAARGEIGFIAVVMGASSGDERFASARKLLDYGFANWTMTKLEIDDALIPDVKVLKGVKNFVEIQDLEMPRVLVPKGREKELKYEVKADSDAVAPVEEGQKLGKILVKLGNETILEIPLCAAYGVEEMSFLRALGLLFLGLVAL